MSDEQQAPDPQVTMSRDEIFALHPLPWSHHLLLIKDAKGQQVVHTGGLYSERGRLHEGKYLSGLNALLVDEVNAGLPPVAETDGWCECRCHGDPDYHYQTCVHCTQRVEIHSSSLRFNGTELECDGNELRPDGTCAKCERVNQRIANKVSTLASVVRR